MAKGWKTVMFNAISGLLYGADKVGASDLGLGDNPEIFALVLLVGNTVLRFFTDTPVFKDSSK